MAAATRPSSSARRATSATREPSRPSWRAILAPMPDDAPTTIARCQGSAMPSAEVHPLAQDEPDHLEARPHAVPAGRGVLRRAAAAAIVAHRDLDHASADADRLDHHLRRERGVVPGQVRTDLAVHVAPDRPVGAADVGEARLDLPPQALDELPDEDVAP